MASGGSRIMVKTRLALLYAVVRRRIEGLKEFIHVPAESVKCVILTSNASPINPWMFSPMIKLKYLLFDDFKCLSCCFPLVIFLVHHPRHCLFVPDLFHSSSDADITDAAKGLVTIFLLKELRMYIIQVLKAKGW